MALPPVWLFTGPEFGERTAAVEDLRRRFKKTAGGLDAHNLYAGDAKIGDVISLLQNGSLFASARFVVLRNAEVIKKKEDIDLITAWITESGGGGSALVLLSDEIGIDKKLEAAVPKEQKRIFWELFEDRKEQWLRNFFQRNGFKIEDDAVQTILELVENNTEALRADCTRFFFYFESGHTVTAADAENILSHNREESAFTLFDRLSGGSFENSLEVLQKIRGSKESSGVQLIAGLTFCFRRLLVWHELWHNNSPSDFDLKIKGFSSSRAKEQYRAAARLWSAADTERILALLARTDMDIRSGGTALEETYLELLIYSICFKKGEAAAAAVYSE